MADTGFLEAAGGVLRAAQKGTPTCYPAGGSPRCLDYVVTGRSQCFEGCGMQLVVDARMATHLPI
eukprot:2814358-Alexandrium_andersonii.AAC.1